MEALKKEITEKIFGKISGGAKWYKMQKPINSETINKALETYGSVEIPYIGEEIIIETPIILASDNHLKVDEKQVMRQAENSVTCLARNKNIQFGNLGVTDETKRDKNISIEGGVWNVKNRQRAYADKSNDPEGSLAAVILSGVEQISLKNMRIFDREDIGKGDTDSSYGIQLSDCRYFLIENIDFYDNDRDGVHLNGPAEYGYIKHIRGEKMGDDMVALNAWDWKESAITFGKISKIIIEDVKGPGNELRILPGQKIFDDGTRVDCDICDCIYENISGAYTFKMYAQPNILNAEIGTEDVSGTVGNISNLYFKNISFAEVTPTGFNGIPVKSLFEICADCNGLHYEDIYVNNSKARCEELGVNLINVGPLSAVWKNGSENPDDWGEVFDPDAICTAENIYLRNIMFSGEKITDAKKLVNEIKMEINTDYPNTLPKGGTGYGTVRNVISE